MGQSSSSSLRGDAVAGGVRGGKAYVPTHGPEVEETAMGRRWIRWLHKKAMKQWVVPGIIAASTLVKLAIGLGSYSGA